MADSKSVPLLDVSARARQYPVSAVPGIDATLNRPRRGSDDFWFDRARMRYAARSKRGTFTPI